MTDFLSSLPLSLSDSCICAFRIRPGRNRAEKEKEKEEDEKTTSRLNFHIIALSSNEMRNAVPLSSLFF